MEKSWPNLRVRADTGTTCCVVLRKHPNEPITRAGVMTIETRTSRDRVGKLFVVQIIPATVIGLLTRLSASEDFMSKSIFFVQEKLFNEPLLAYQILATGNDAVSNHEGKKYWVKVVPGVLCCFCPWAPARSDHWRVPPEHSHRVLKAETSSLGRHAHHLGLRDGWISLSPFGRRRILHDRS